MELKSGLSRAERAAKVTRLVEPPDEATLAPLRGAYRETLVGQREALAALSVAGEAPDLAEAVTSVRRLARAIRSVSSQLGLWNVSFAATELEAAQSESAWEPAVALLSALDDAIEGSREQAVRILVAEPDPDNGDLLALTLSAPHREIDVVTSGSEALRKLGSHSYSLIILEIDLPDADGRDLLAQLRSKTSSSLVPVFVLSSRVDPTTKTECLALGADAYFEKPYDPASLSSVVAARVQRRATYESTDPLTGLPDRTAFEEAFRRIRMAPRNAELDLSLALLDFDHFSSIGDLYGHSISDAVLRRSMDLIAQVLPHQVLLARWDAQRFVALFPDVPVPTAAELLDRALQTVRHEPFRAGNQHPFVVSFSSGVVQVGVAARTADEAVSAARERLAQAKERGGSRIVSGDDRPEHRASHVLLAEDDALVAKIVRHALERSGYVVRHESNGLAAVGAAENSSVDLVILDVRLPGLGGFEVLARLRDMPALSQVPIIMLTGIGGERDILRGFELGADDYILKPFSRIELIARVTRLLQRRRDAPALQ